MSTISVQNTDAQLSGKTMDILETDQTITGLKTFSRSTNPPFAVNSGAANVANLDADKLDGQDWAAPTITGAPTFSGSINLTGGQILFPATQVPSANANTLDDYEEGTWTPAIGGSGGQSGQVYTNQEGRYIKIGSMVWIAFFVALSTLGTITGNVQIYSLPFTAENNVLQFYGGHINWANLTTSVISVPCYVAQNTSILNLFKHTAAATSAVSASLAQVDLAPTSSFRGFALYRAAA